MNLFVYKVTLDMNESTSQVYLNIRKNDTARKFIFSFRNFGKLYEIGNGCTAVFRAKKPSGNILFNNCTINGNEVEYIVTSQTVAETGIVECELTLYGSDGKQITSPRFTLGIEDSLYSDDEVESEDEFTELQEAIAAAQNLDISVEEDGDTVTITITKKDGTEQSVTLHGGGGGGGFNIHALPAENSLEDGDELALYDVSANAHRKTTWSNIKTKLKTYFDTLYIGASALSGYATQAWVNAQGFIKSLAGYATEEYVGEAVSDATSDMATQTWVRGRGYITADDIPVLSVNGKTGIVTLTAADLGISTLFDLKGSKPTVAALPTTGNKYGDVWYVIAESVGYIWLNDGTTDRWEMLGMSVDLSTYATKAELTTALTGYVAKVAGKGLSTNDFTDAYKTKLDSAITSLAGYATETYVNNGLSGKQDTISDLSTIRSGAAAGATAVQPDDLPAPEVFTAVYGTTSYAEIAAAYNAGKKVQCKRESGGSYYVYDLTLIAGDVVRFGQLSNSQLYTVSVTSTDVWSAANTAMSDLARTAQLEDYRTSAAQDLIDAEKQPTIDASHKLPYAYISDTPTIPTVPTAVSAFTNDVGYLTQHQSLSAYRTATEQNAIDEEKIPKSAQAAKTAAMTQPVGIDANGKLWSVSGSGSEGNFELIETIITTEEVAEIVRTQEPDNTPYNFKRLAISVDVTKTVSSYVYVELPSNRILYGQGSGVGRAISFFDIKIENGYLFYETNMSPERYNSSWGLSGIRPTEFLKWTASSFTEITVLMSTGNIPTGTKIEIWGVRA